MLLAFDSHRLYNSKKTKIDRRMNTAAGPGYPGFGISNNVTIKYNGGG